MDTRPRRSAHFSWKPELHDAFLAAIDACGGMFKCTPSEIMYEMIKQGTVVPGLESKQIKSHLQNERTRHKRAGSNSFSQKSSLPESCPPPAATAATNSTLKKDEPSSDFDHSHQDGDGNGDDIEEENLAEGENGGPSKKQRKDDSDEEGPQQREQEEGGGEGVEEEEDTRGTDAEDNNEDDTNDDNEEEDGDKDKGEEVEDTAVDVTTIMPLKDAPAAGPTVASPKSAIKGGKVVNKHPQQYNTAFGVDDDLFFEQIQHKMDSLVQCNVEREDLMKKLLLAARRSEHLGRHLKANQKRSSVLLEDLDRLCTWVSRIGPRIKDTVQLKLSEILMKLLNGGAAVGDGTGTGLAGPSQVQQAQRQQRQHRGTGIADYDDNNNNNIIVQEQPHQQQPQPQQQQHHQQRRGGVVVSTDYRDASADNMFGLFIGGGGNQGMVGPVMMPSYVQQQCQQMLGIGANTTTTTTTTNNNNNNSILQNNNMAADQLDPQQQQIMALLSELLSQTAPDAADMQLQQILNGGDGGEQYGDGGADMNDGANLEAANAFFSLLAATAQQQQQQDEKQQQ